MIKLVTLGKVREALNLLRKSNSIEKNSINTYGEYRVLNLNRLLNLLLFLLMY